MAQLNARYTPKMNYKAIFKIPCCTLTMQIWIRTHFIFIFYRFASSQLGDTVEDALLIVGKVGKTESSLKINLSLKSESHPLVIPILNLTTSNLPMPISIKAETKERGLILISPLEITVDRPVYIGCFSSFSSSDLIPELSQTSSHLDCLVLCNNQSKRYVLLHKTKCYCHSDDSYYQLFMSGSLVPSAQCNITCESDTNSYCGGVHRYSVYLASKCSYLLKQCGLILVYLVFWKYECHKLQKKALNWMKCNLIWFANIVPTIYQKTLIGVNILYFFISFKIVVFQATKYFPKSLFKIQNLYNILFITRNVFIL